MHSNPILDWLTGYRALTTVSVACELGLFTLLAGQPQSADELARRADADPGALMALLDAGVGLGLLHYDGERYRNSQLAGNCSAKLLKGGLRPPFWTEAFSERKRVSLEDWPLRGARRALADYQETLFVFLSERIVRSTVERLLRNLSP